MNSEQNISLSGLPKSLIQAGLLNEKQAVSAQQHAIKQKLNFINYIVKEKIADALKIADIAANNFGTPFLDLNSLDPEVIPKDILSEKLVRQHNVLPIYKHHHRLFIAVADPTNLRAIDEIKFQTGMSIETIVVAADSLNEMIELIFQEPENSAFDDLEDADLDSLDIDFQNDEELNSDDDNSEVDDAPIVRFVNKILLDAINQGGSDIHFEPYEKNYRIRVRQDGILRQVASPPINLAPRLAARIKVMSRLDISERRVPQDGRFKMKLSKRRSIDFRVSTCPTLFGEKVVMRILDPTSAQIGIDALGYEPEQKKLFLEAIHKPQGMVLVTGPTGSGKTVSLYTALNILNTDEKNISTAEDPVEINLSGINQVNVNPKAGLYFSSALKSFLRQDPDIVMVGEIRDLETAEIAVKAAQTGHLVLSTLHTNSAAETIVRLMNMGIPAYNLAASVTLIIAQRLLRKLCDNCKEKITIPEEELLRIGFDKTELNEINLYAPKGCDKCTDGYKGRTGIYEVMPVDEELGKIIMNGANVIELNNFAIEKGMVSIRRSGLNKAKNGITSLEEVYRVSK